MASLLYPIHEHPLEPVDSRYVRPVLCEFCRKEVSKDDDVFYACKECGIYLHSRCAEAPLRIEGHPFHPSHTLSFVHDQLMTCDACKENFHHGGSSFSCDECCFNLDLQCALSIATFPPDVPPPQAEHVAEGLHDYELTPFSAKWKIDLRCMLCTGFIEGDGYICLLPRCKFLIHKRCIRDLFYEDGTRVQRVYHVHSLATFPGDEAGFVGSGCMSCQSERSGEYIGCARCKWFIHRDCVRAPEILKYPLHPDHSLVLFIARPVNHYLLCRSCSCLIQRELCYSCISCEFHLHIECAIRTIGYFKDGMSLKIELSWHEHPMLLCHRPKPVFDSCPCCEDKFDGPAYVCREKDCRLVLHKQCTEIEPKIDHHPHHPEHPLALLTKVSGWLDQCAACHSTIEGFRFFCKLCEFYFHVKCMTRFPTRKHYLHEHDLVRFDEILSVECNRCRTVKNSPIFRCVPCNFNLHEECMELPQVVKHKTHFHPLTLREFFREDDSGEYYCDICEERRDGRLGVYVCGDCERKMDRPWAFHIECILPELRKVYEKDNTNAKKRLSDGIEKRQEEIRATERKLEEMKRELEELMKQQAAMTLD